MFWFENCLKLMEDGLIEGLGFRDPNLTTLVIELFWLWGDGDNILGVLITKLLFEKLELVGVKTFDGFIC